MRAVPWSNGLGFDLYGWRYSVDESGVWYAGHITNGWTGSGPTAGRARTDALDKWAPAQGETE
jgi:hypothetical protein